MDKFDKILMDGDKLQEWNSACYAVYIKMEIKRIVTVTED
jgi:hypothetical protein